MTRTIDMLPDLALLRIFEFFIIDRGPWITLVHVCRQWRDIVFGSSRRLGLVINLQPCSGTLCKEILDIWSPLPIVIKTCRLIRSYVASYADNIVVALEHNANRIRKLNIDEIPGSEMGKVLAAMQQPFPSLTYLRLEPSDKAALIAPTSFLGGSAPSLQELFLNRISFPGLPNLLFSATHLFNLCLERIPDSGYFSPEAIVTCLPVLTRLGHLTIKFESPQSRSDRTSEPLSPQTRTLLPFLTALRFQGVTEYLEDLVAWIDAPRLKLLDITFPELIIGTPQLAQFISRTPKLMEQDKAFVTMDFSDYSASLRLARDPEDCARLNLNISCRQSDRQLLSLARVRSSCLPQALIPLVEELIIITPDLKLDMQDEIESIGWGDDIENIQWLELIEPFTAVRTLYLSPETVRRIGPALQELVGERVMDVLPDLYTILIYDPVPSSADQRPIKRFVAARRLAGKHMVLSGWYSYVWASSKFGVS